MNAITCGEMVKLLMQVLRFNFTQNICCNCVIYLFCENCSIVLHVPPTCYIEATVAVHSACKVATLTTENSGYFLFWFISNL